MKKTTNSKSSAKADKTVKKAQDVAPPTAEHDSQDMLPSQETEVSFNKKTTGKRSKKSFKLGEGVLDSVKEKKKSAPSTKKDENNNEDGDNSGDEDYEEEAWEEEDEEELDEEDGISIHSSEDEDSDLSGGEEEEEEEDDDVDDAESEDLLKEAAKPPARGKSARTLKKPVSVGNTANDEGKNEKKKKKPVSKPAEPVQQEEETPIVESDGEGDGPVSVSGDSGIGDWGNVIDVSRRVKLPDMQFSLGRDYFMTCSDVRVKRSKYNPTPYTFKALTFERKKFFEKTDGDTCGRKSYT
mgnify:CR=1 FL=1